MDPKIPAPKWVFRKGRTVAAKVLGFEKLHITAHALERMKERGIKQNEVIETLRAPDGTGLPCPPGRKRVRKHRNRHTSIDVVYIDSYSDALVA